METQLVKNIFYMREEGKPYEEGEQALHISWNEPEPSMPGYQRRKFFYINNPDGTIRWIFESQSKKPIYLQLYNSASPKAKLYTWISRWVFRIGLHNFLASGHFYLYWKEKPPLWELLDHFQACSYGIFTGTRGENRKSVIAISSLSGQSHFLKLAHTASAKSLILQEAKQLSRLTSEAFCYSAVPQVNPLSNDSFNLLSNIQPSAYSQSSYWEDQHINALFEWHNTFLQSHQLRDTEFWEDLLFKWKELTPKTPLDNELDLGAVQRLKAFLSQGIHSLDPEAYMQFSLCHGDFTPWNMYLGAKKIWIYDWELSRNRMPVLFDLFHFIYQSGILLQGLGFSQILAQIEEALAHPKALELIRRSACTVDQLHLMYLMYICCYYLPIYLKMPKALLQSHWTIAIWEEAFMYLLTEKRTHFPFINETRNTNSKEPLLNKK